MGYSGHFSPRSAHYGIHVYRPTWREDSKWVKMLSKIAWVVHMRNTFKNQKLLTQQWKSSKECIYVNCSSDWRSKIIQKPMIFLYLFNYRYDS